MSRASAEEIEVAGRTVRVSNPDKPYFTPPGGGTYTKRDVVSYVVSVADGLLGATFERPTTLERWPGGYFEGAKLSTRSDHRGDAFYQSGSPKVRPNGWRRPGSPFRAEDRPTRCARPSPRCSRGRRISGR